LDPISKRRSQIAIGLSILGVACVLSYYSIEEKANPSYDICLAIDVSYSMVVDDNGLPLPKLSNAQNAAKEFVETLSASPDNKICLVAFAGEAKVVSKLTDDSAALINSIQSLTPAYSTAIGSGVGVATEVLVNEGRSHTSKIILLLSDGFSNEGIDPVSAAESASQNKITIYTIGYGTDADTFTLNKIASMSGGQYFDAQSGQDIADVFNRISKILISPLAHYGSRTLILVAVPILLFMPLLEKMAVTMIQKAEQTFIDKRGPQKSTCVKCGYMNKPNSKFCAKCGFKIR
jgi:Ca-activated chloride channel family protein